MSALSIIPASAFRPCSLCTGLDLDCRPDRPAVPVCVGCRAEIERARTCGCAHSLMRHGRGCGCLDCECPLAYVECERGCGRLTLDATPAPSDCPECSAKEHAEREAILAAGAAAADEMDRQRALEEPHRFCEQCEDLAAEMMGERTGRPLCSACWLDEHEGRAA